MLIRFHGDLPSLLAHRWRNSPQLELPLSRRTSIKDFIEALGPPHTEVGSILVSGQEVDFNYRPVPEDEVEVLPPVPPVDVGKPSPLRPKPFSGVRFIADVNVGKLARLLRMLGFDVFYRNDLDDEIIAATASAEQRICLTMDGRLLKRRQIIYGRLVRSQAPEQQTREVVHLYGLADLFRPFSRCLRCNELLAPVAKEVIIDRLEPLTRKYYDAFYRCPKCKKIYWPGSHREHMEKIITGLALDLP
jgi:uncharacterized protein